MVHHDDLGNVVCGLVVPQIRMVTADNGPTCKRHKREGSGKKNSMMVGGDSQIGW